jgi:tetratricopeptide (TPR) repeat protein
VIFTVKAAPLASSWAETLVLQSRIAACYLRNIVWPADLCADYGPYSIRNFGVAASVTAVLTLVAAQVLCARRSRLFALGAVVFWFALLPVSNFVPIFRPMADRYLYMPLTGAAMMLAAMPARAMRVAFLPLMAVAAAFAVQGTTQQRIWHDSFSLWKATAAANPASESAANNLAFAHFERGEMEASLESAGRAIRLRKGRRADDFAVAALALDALGRTAEADAAFRKAAALEARYADPDKLIAGLTWSRSLADKLKIISQRN